MNKFIICFWLLFLPGSCLLGQEENYSKLDPADYHQIGSGLRNSQIQFEQNKKARVAFLGGSITYNGGWRDSVSNYLQTRFPATEFEFIAAGIPSMGTTPAAFRLERDVLSKGKIDLLFEEAAVNDASNGRSSDEQIKAMEGIFRHLRKSNPAIDIVMMHFVDPSKMKEYNQNIEPDVIYNHNRVAEHYNIPTINLAKEVTDRINNKEFTWKKDFKNLHPSPFGQGIYANSMISFLSNAYVDEIGSDNKITPHILPDPIDKYAFDQGQLIDIKKAKLSTDWNIESNWSPEDGTGTRSNYTNVPMLISNTPGDALKLKFKGTAVGIAVAAGQDVGFIEFRIDKGEWTELNLFTKWSKSLHLPWYYTLSNELSDKKHLLEVRTSANKDERSTGNACRIRYFYTNQR
jgi:sialidase-1